MLERSSRYVVKRTLDSSIFQEHVIAPNCSTQTCLRFFCSLYSQVWSLHWLFLSSYAVIQIIHCFLCLVGILNNYWLLKYSMPEVFACKHTRNIFSLILLAEYTLAGNHRGHKKEESTFHTAAPIHYEWVYPSPRVRCYCLVRRNMLFLSLCVTFCML